MAVVHILADGSRPTDITGHVVKKSAAPGAYSALEHIKKRPPSGDLKSREHD